MPAEEEPVENWAAPIETDEDAPAEAHAEAPAYAPADTPAEVPAAPVAAELTAPAPPAKPPKPDQPKEPDVELAEATEPVGLIYPPPELRSMIRITATRPLAPMMCHGSACLCCSRHIR